MTVLEKLKTNDFEKFSRESLIWLVKMCRDVLEQRDELIKILEERINLTDQLVKLKSQKERK